MKHNVFSKGTTLVELLLYIGMFLLLLGAMMQIFSSILDVQLESQASSSVTQDGRYILARFTYDMQNAQSISVPTSAGATTNSLQLVVNGATYTYALSNGNLQLTTTNGTSNINSFDTKVSNLSFQRLGNSGGKHTISMSFTLTSVTQRFEGAETKDFQETIGLR